MDFQVVQDHADHGSVGIGHVHNPLHLAGKIRHGEPVGDVHVAPASQRFAEQGDVAGASAAILVALTSACPPLAELKVSSKHTTDGQRRRALRTGPAHPP